MSKDNARIQSFRAQKQYIDGVMRRFEAVGFSVESVYEGDNALLSWGAALKPSVDLAHDIGSSLELLLWVDAFDEFEPRSLERIKRQLQRLQPRLREDIVFFVSNDDRVSDHVALLPSDANVIAFSLSLLRSYKSPLGPDFRRHLLSKVFSRDPYKFTGAVVQHWQFFGRGRIIAELVASVSTGQRIGLFGLRKIGKTSLLLRLIEQLRTVNRNIIVAHLQVARVDAIRRSSNYFLWSVGQAISLSIPKNVRTPAFRLFGRPELFGDLTDVEEKSIPELFLHDVGLILRKPTLRLCLIFDEIERMWPSSKDPSTQSWATEFPKIWQLLRSMDQEFPERISIVVAGTNPECIEQPKIGIRDNPLFQYIQVRYLPFLEYEESCALLKNLGARGGLHWNDDACRIAYEQVSGHPALLRVLGSAVYADGKSHERRRLLAESNVADATIATYRESAPILSEICGALQEGYPDDYLLLSSLARSRIGEFLQFSEAFPEAILHLQGFGLIDNSQPPSISFSLLQTHMQAERRVRSVDSTTAHIPTTIGNYKVIASLGRSGGFGAVYKCANEDGNSVAVKLLHSGSLAALNREVDILKSISQSNIVRFIDSGHDESGNYIVMEYLAGLPWTRHCTRATRLNAKEIKPDIIKLAKALHYIHPKGTPASEELGELGIQEILERRLGYVHRDIKPENIIAVARRGPVLIDFGISSRSGDPTKTTSATPGYLPPDFVADRWDPDIDLFQLGLTLLQILVGETYAGEAHQLVDLRTALDVDTSIPKQIKMLVLRMCELEKRNRFRSASEVLTYLGI